MIEDVEEFRTELEPVALLESPVFRHREVDVRDRFSSHYASSQRSGLTCRRSRESRRVQVLRTITGLEIERCASVIRTLPDSTGSTKGIGVRRYVDRSGA